jgi:hypothetical protein
MLSGPSVDDKKKPGPHQWEATFSRTSYRVTTQAVKQFAKKAKINFGSLVTELKRLIKLFFKKKKKYLFF